MPWIAQSCGKKKTNTWWWRSRPKRQTSPKLLLYRLFLRFQPTWNLWHPSIPCLDLAGQNSWPFPMICPQSWLHSLQLSEWISEHGWTGPSLSVKHGTSHVETIGLYIYIYIYIIHFHAPGLFHAMGCFTWVSFWHICCGKKIYSNQCFIWPLLLGWPSKYLSPLCSNHVNLRNRSSTSVPVLTGMTCLRKAGEIDIILAKKSLDRHLQGNQIHPDSRTTWVIALHKRLSRCTSEHWIESGLPMG